VLAHWKDEHRAAEAEATNKVAAAEALASRREAELREAQTAEGKRNAEMVAAMDQWRDIVKGKDEQVSHLQAQVRVAPLISRFGTPPTRITVPTKKGHVHLHCSADSLTASCF